MPIAYTSDVVLLIAERIYSARGTDEAARRMRFTARRSKINIVSKHPTRGEWIYRIQCVCQASSNARPTLNLYRSRYPWRAAYISTKLHCILFVINAPYFYDKHSRHSRYKHAHVVRHRMNACTLKIKNRVSGFCSFCRTNRHRAVLWKNRIRLTIRRENFNCKIQSTAKRSANCETYGGTL